MKRVEFGTKARKDLKRYKNDRRKMEALYNVLDILRKSEDLPASYKPHRLSGNYVGCLECHIENDYLLIWQDEDENMIYILRLGSHSELFG